MSDNAKPTFMVRPAKAADTFWEVENSSTKPGARMQLWATKGENARWYIDYTTLGRAVITNVLSGLVAGIHVEPRNGAKLLQLDRNTAEPWQYEFTLHRDRDRPDLQFFSLAAQPLYRIECENGNVGSGTALQLWGTTLEPTLRQLEAIVPAR